MSLFLDYRCEDGMQTHVPVTCSAWSDAELILAVGYEDHRVSFFQDEGQCWPGAEITRDAVPSAMAWQPHGSLLAVGWSDGTVSTYAVSGAHAGEEPPEAHVAQTRVVASNSNEHGSRIALLLWSPAGNRLITGDEQGFCTVWKADRGGMKQAVQYRKGARLTAAVFCAPPSELLSKALTPPFFFASEDGVVYYADDIGHCDEVSIQHAPVDQLVFYEERSQLILVTRTLLMTQLLLTREGEVRPGIKVKLSVAGDAKERGIRDLLWAGPGLLTTASGEGLVRFWNLSRDENYVLPLRHAGAEASDRADCAAFSAEHRLLAVGTREGRVLQWRYNGSYDADLAPNSRSNSSAGLGLQGARRGEGADGWEPLPPVDLDAPVLSLTWCRGFPLLCAVTRLSVFMLSETQLQQRLGGSFAVVQTGADVLRVAAPGEEGGGYALRTGIHVKGIALCEAFLCAYNGKRAELWELGARDARRRSAFRSGARGVAMVLAAGTLTLYQCGAAELEVCNGDGIRKKRGGAFSGDEGSPAFVDANGPCMCCVSDLGVLKRYHQGTREDTHQVGSAGRFVEAGGGAIGAIRAVRVNSDGSKVAILSDRLRGGAALGLREPDTRLHVFDFARDEVLSHDFGTRYPVGIAWDDADPKLLTVETRRLRWVAARERDERIAEEKEGGYPQGGTSEGVPPRGVPPPRDPPGAAAGPGAAARGSGALGLAAERDAEVCTAFVTSDEGILIQDSFSPSCGGEALLGIRVPRIYMSRRPTREETKAEGSPLVTSRVMRDFVGLEDVDEETRAALMRFSYCLATGNMDAAYRAVKLIRSPSVWENMAHMCVKTKRLDVAEVCLGNMGHARGAAAVRRAKEEPEPEAAVAAVAIQLGLLEDAAALYRSCKRFDLLNRLYQAAGLWERALRIAEKSDRIHLKATHHAFARHLESVGDFKGAARHYEDAETHRKEVPRMLFEQALVDPSRLDDLEGYISRTADPELLKWWAAYCESVGDFDKAGAYYRRAGDSLSRVRLACYSRDLERAADIVNETRCPAAAYHMARHLEGLGEVREAIGLYTRSGCYNHAIRLAKRSGLDAELMGFALKSRPALMVDVARYFEAKGDLEKAVQLYQRGGDAPKALDLCFAAAADGRAGMFDALQSITDALGAEDGSADPETLLRCADFMLKHGHGAKAVGLYVACGRFREAIELCASEGVAIDEALAERLTPPAPPKGASARGSADRLATIALLARACKRQNALHLASKKYTQAGEHLKALKCLIRAGDTKNVVFYANRVGRRDPSLLVIAANYLQTLDWHGDEAVVKAIVSFYTKAKEWEKLSAFYDACAAQEIDDYSDYSKALQALREAHRHAASLPPARAAALGRRIAGVERFLAARDAGGEEMLRICAQLLQSAEAEGGVRHGDVLALCVAHHAREERWADALAALEEMRRRRVPLQPFVEAAQVERIHAMAGVAPPEEAGEGKSEGDIDEEIDESVDLEDSAGDADGAWPAEAKGPGGRRGAEGKKGGKL